MAGQSGGREPRIYLRLVRDQDLGRNSVSGGRLFEASEIWARIWTKGRSLSCSCLVRLCRRLCAKRWREALKEARLFPWHSFLLAARLLSPLAPPPLPLPDALFVRRSSTRNDPPLTSLSYLFFPLFSISTSSSRHHTSRHGSWTVSEPPAFQDLRRL